jgi:hypothetical protein
MLDRFQKPSRRYARRGIGCLSHERIMSKYSACIGWSMPEQIRTVVIDRSGALSEIKEGMPNSLWTCGAVVCDWTQQSLEDILVRCGYCYREPASFVQCTFGSNQ